MLHSEYFEYAGETQQDTIKTIVLFHGFGGNYKIWKKQIPLFQRYCNVLTIDLPSHYEGNLKLSEMEVTLDSIANKIIEVLDSYGVKKAIFIGVSLGTVFVKYIEAYHSEYVEMGVLVGAMAAVDAVLEGTAKLLAKVGDKLPFKTTYNIFSHVFMPGKKCKKSREVFNKCAEALNSKEFKLYMNIFEHAFKFNRQFEKTVHAENIYISGTRDNCFIHGAIAEAKKTGAKFMSIIDCGHVCNIDSRDKFEELIRSILNEHLGLLKMGGKMA